MAFFLEKAHSFFPLAAALEGSSLYGGEFKAAAT
jgi:hypothetical protein